MKTRKVRQKDKKFPIVNDIPYRQAKWLSLSTLADFIGEFTNDDKESPVWDFFFWLDNRSTKIKTRKEK